MRLKEWIESHPQSSFDMMTPGGYVFLTPKQAKELLEGKDMKAHLGISGYDITVSAEELLAQNVVNVNGTGLSVICLRTIYRKGNRSRLLPDRGW